MGVVAKPGFVSVRRGMTYEQVVASLGPEDGSVRAAELISYEESVCSWCTRRVDHKAFERSGGRFLFWLSRSDNTLVFNVVALDANNTVIQRWSADDTFFGKD
jgi:hypothetical protein